MDIFPNITGVVVYWKQPHRATTEKRLCKQQRTVTMSSKQVLISSN